MPGGTVAADRAIMQYVTPIVPACDSMALLTDHGAPHFRLRH
jgi:hypothetical protein